MDGIFLVPRLRARADSAAAARARGACCERSWFRGDTLGFPGRARPPRGEDSSCRGDVRGDKCPASPFVCKGGRSCPALAGGICILDLDRTCSLLLACRTARLAVRWRFRDLRGDAEPAILS